MSHEPAYLISAIRRFLHDEPLPDARNIDWRMLLQLAGNHAVTPMLYTALRGEKIPDDIASSLRADFESCVQASLAQSAELARLAGIFEEDNIPVIFIKGPLLSRHLYENLGSRSSGD